jgi:hypothetical protein
LLRGYVSMIKKIAVIAASLAMIGCASSYIPPKEGPTASIRIVASTIWGGNVNVMHVPEAGVCGWNGVPTYVNVKRIGSLNGIALDHGRRKLSLPGSEGLRDRDYTEIVIPAGRPFAFDISGHEVGHAGTSSAPGTVTIIGGPRCNATMEFTPGNGKIYEAIFATVPFENPTGCVISVSEIVTGAGGSVVRRPEKTAHPRDIQCNDGDLKIGSAGSVDKK